MLILRKAASLLKKGSYEEYDNSHEHADEYETSESMSSKESTPANLPERSHAKRKWSTAIRVVQGLHRFRLPLHRRVREREMHTSNESTPSREIEEVPDPVYLALKQATGRYGRRGSSTHLYDSNTPSPRNLSQVSLQDSGYVEMSCAQANPLLGSTPHLENAGRSTGRRRAPKLTTQMKSLSLDCQEMPPRIQASGVTRSPLRNKYMQRPNSGKNSQSDLSDWDRSCSPCVNTSRRTSTAPSGTEHGSARGGYIVIHEYNPGNGYTLNLGDRIHIVDNGDPDWLHGFKQNDRNEYLLTFPATCVAPLLSGEQPMRIIQNVAVPELKLRMYRDQIVFAQKDTLIDGKVTVRTEHNAFAACPLTSLTLI